MDNIVGVTFGVKKFSLRTCIPKENLKLSMFPEDILQATVLNMEIRMASNLSRVEERKETTRYPATMWEELKRDYAPAWFLRRHPVRYLEENTRYTINHYRVCPHMGIPDTADHIKFLMKGDDDE